jgi:hypothetical protein
MAQNSIDSDIATAWDRLYESYCQGSSFSNSEPDSLLCFNVSEEIPLLTKLIDNEANKPQLEHELKQVIMKYYWNGYHNGIYNSKIAETDQDKPNGT